MRFHSAIFVSLVVLTGTATALPVAIRPPANIKARDPAPVELSHIVKPTYHAGQAISPGAIAGILTGVGGALAVGAYFGYKDLRDRYRAKAQGGNTGGTGDIEFQRRPGAENTANSPQMV